MSDRSNTLITLTFDGAIRINGSAVVCCPRCTATTGLTMSARLRDRASAATCPSGHTWRELRITGQVLNAIYERSR